MSACVPWHMSCQPSGYGQTFRDGKVVFAHRVAYEDQIGPIPPGMQVHHTCERRDCVNVEHMELLRRDDHSGGLGHGKLLREQARQVRDLAGAMPHRWVAEVYGISSSMVSMIGSGKRWAAA